MREHNLNPAKIVGECSACGHLYDICRNGLCCDVCGGMGIRGARLVSQQEAQEYGSEARTRLRNALEDVANGVDLDPDATREITWCEKLFALDNEGSTR